MRIRWISEPPDRCYLLLSERRTELAPEQLRSLELTARETEVLHWLAEGKSNDAIAILLALSKRTVEKHVERILAKPGVESRTAAALLATE